jgi:hypothetical protein
MANQQSVKSKEMALTLSILQDFKIGLMTFSLNLYKD